MTKTRKKQKLARNSKTPAATRPDVEDRDIEVLVLQRKKSDLLIAYSDDLPGLLVTGRTIEELEDRIPRAVKEILEAQGHVVLRVTTKSDRSQIPSDFGPAGYTANAVYQHAA